LICRYCEGIKFTELWWESVQGGGGVEEIKGGLRAGVGGEVII